MNKDVTFPDYYKTGIACAIAYCIPLLFFLKNEQLTGTWILYIGNLAFTIILLISAAIINKRLHDETSIMQMLSAGTRLAIAGIVCTIPVMVALFFLFGHQFVRTGPANETFPGLFLLLLTNVVIVDIFVGCFGILFAALISKQYPKNKKGEDIT
jgi:uncharacterized membrane protein YhaH (DUF805 family)